MKNLLLRILAVSLGLICFVCFPMQNNFSLEESAENHIISAAKGSDKADPDHGPPSI